MNRIVAVTLKIVAFFLIFFGYVSCSDNESVVEIPQHLEVNWQDAPFEKLSDYGFYKGNLNDLTPHPSLILYEPAAELFTDEAQKQRLIWLPKNTQMTYQSANRSPAFPEGSIIIKSFFYEKALPNATRKILETRVMLKRGSGWEFYSYVWNDEQSEANLSQTPIWVDLEWISDQGGNKATQYVIPSPNQCALCHGNGADAKPLGMQPMQLAMPLKSATNGVSQWADLIEKNKIVNAPNVLPIQMVSPWDTQKSLNERARSYLHVNCAHCHSEVGNASNTPMRLDYTLTVNNSQNLGICVQPVHQVVGEQMRIVTPGSPNQSQLYYRMGQSLNEWQMPNFGRTIHDTRGLQLINDWITSLENCD